MNRSFLGTDLLASETECSAPAGSVPATSGSLPPLLEQRSQAWVELELMLHHTSFPRAEYERVVRIMRDFAAGYGTLVSLPPSVVIWGSSRTRPGEPAYLAAVETSRLLARSGFGIITGGGPGIMEAGNKGAREAGAVSVGLPMEALDGEPPNQFLDLAVEFKYFVGRKAMFVRFAEALVIFPGGYGTMDELFEALLLIQLKKVRPVPIILYGSRFWRGLIDWIRLTLAEEAKTIDPHHPDLLTVSDDPQEIVSLAVDAYRAAARAQGEPSPSR
jgi:uncharacterized protein (TIGR00730 family)